MSSLEHETEDYKDFSSASFSSIKLEVYVLRYRNAVNPIVIADQKDLSVARRGMRGQLSDEAPVMP